MNKHWMVGVAAFFGLVSMACMTTPDDLVSESAYALEESPSGARCGCVGGECCCAFPDGTVNCEECDRCSGGGGGGGIGVIGCEDLRRRCIEGGEDDACAEFSTQCDDGFYQPSSPIQTR